MLLEFGARNFYSFDEGFEASLRLGEDCPQAISRGPEAATVVCVKGANASGKTNVLRTLVFIRDFCCHSFLRKPEEPIPTAPHFSESPVSDFYIVLSRHGKEYRYELSASPERVETEELFMDGKPLVRRKGCKFTFLASQFKGLKTVKLRKNASFISTAHQYEVKAIQGIYGQLSLIESWVEEAAKRQPLNPFEISRSYHADKDSFEFTKRLVAKCDLGSSDIEITRTKGDAGNEAYTAIFLHETDKGMRKLGYDAQSSGTRALFELLYLYYKTLRTGGIRVVDEFDISLHPHILRVLVGLFDDPKSNPKKAQLLFTTHDSAIMETLGKHRTLMVVKEDNASFVYRLDEIPGDILAGGSSISGLYEAGRIGGVPRIS